MEPANRIPRHVAIIMDGNGRWAEEKGRERIFGHSNGVESVRKTLKASVRHGVRYLTLYAFSTENWGRPSEEVDALMELLCRSVRLESEELQRQGVCVKVIGDRSRMSDEVQQHLTEIERETADGQTLTLTLAINYSARWELTQAVRVIARNVREGNILPEEITAHTVEGHLSTSGCPDPDLLIRTGGEYRLSNFLLWQLAYSELYFTDTYWPDFSEAEFDRAIDAYRQRERRFGLIMKTEQTKIE